MPWNKSPNLGMYEGANWDGYVKTVPNSSPEQARRVAMLDPTITFFFFFREYMVLTNPQWPSSKVFKSGDAVFFKGEPWFGSATQCDAYQKAGTSIAYVSPSAVSVPGCFTTSNGSAAVDVVCIFAANIDQKLPNGSTLLAPNVTVASNGSIACGNPETMQALRNTTAIQNLQAKGIMVLLTLLNNHDAAGWSEFRSASDAQTFVKQLEVAVSTYGLDGIDIDDEYSAGSSVSSSLAMVTSMMKTAMPDKIISKALWDDTQYFGVVYENSTLEQSLTYGWEMSYGSPPADVMPKYVSAGMNKSALSKGFYAPQPSANVSADVEWLKSNGYAGVMAYAFQDEVNQELLGTLVDAWVGPGNWNKAANCT